MAAIDLKKQLHDYIDSADDRFINLVYGMMLADQLDQGAPDWHKQIIEDRLEEYEQNKADLVSWNDVKKSLEKR